MSRNYVKSTIESGDGSGDLLAISDLVKAARVTEYDAGGLPHPRSDALYLYTTRPHYSPTISTLCIIGSSTKIVLLNNIFISTVGLLDIAYASPNNRRTTLKIEVIRANYTSISAPTGIWADSAIIPADSSESAASASIGVLPVGLSNEERLYSAYFHCDLDNVGFSVFPVSSYETKLHFGREFGRQVIIEDDTQLIMFKITMMSETYNDYMAVINASWYER